jgi:hypothetical protein
MFLWLNSAERYAYGIVSLSIAFGLITGTLSSFKIPSNVFFSLLMVIFSIRFARDLWVA